MLNPRRKIYYSNSSNPNCLLACNYCDSRIRENLVSRRFPYKLTGISRVEGGFDRFLNDQDFNLQFT
jgi:hypothetical protein